MAINSKNTGTTRHTWLQVCPGRARRSRVQLFTTKRRHGSRRSRWRWTGVHFSATSRQVNGARGLQGSCVLEVQASCMLEVPGICVRRAGRRGGTAPHLPGRSRRIRLPTVCMPYLPFVLDPLQRGEADREVYGRGTDRGRRHHDLQVGARGGGVTRCSAGIACRPVPQLAGRTWRTCC